MVVLANLACRASRSNGCCMLTLPSESSGKGAEFGIFMLDERFGCPLLMIEARLFAGFDMKLDLLSEVPALTLDDRRTWTC